MKNLKYLFLASLGLMSAPMLAQETYQDTKFAENSLTGTARYVGMGGAMEALGADISTISSNPAGIGLFRKSMASLSAGVVAQPGADTELNFDKTPFGFDGKKSVPSFDQIGFVWAATNGDSNVKLNFGFNYHKSTNFSQILSAANFLNGASQTKWASAKTAYAKELDEKHGKDAGDQVWNAVDANYNALMGKDEDGNQMTYDGRSFLFGQYQKGYIGEYDFNISVGFNDRVWIGFTLGIHDVHYRNNSVYTENYVADKEAYGTAWESQRITGTGYDAKLGVIFRPVEDSPFRIGAYVNSPVFYDLSMDGTADLELVDKNLTDENGNYADAGKTNSSSLDYRLNTAWKTGISLGHTIGGNLALGATYEYAWYNHMDNRVKDGGYYDYDGYWDEYYETSSSDEVMNDHTKQSLQGVSTLKLGLEYKPINMLALRLGYNYVSPMFKESADRDQTIPSQGTIYATSTDYTNWKATNRFTAGVGFNYAKLSIDVAYQYSCQNGDFYPFAAWESLGANAAPATKVDNKRHQLLMTVGYKF